MKHNEKHMLHTWTLFLMHELDLSATQILIAVLCLKYAQTINTGRNKQSSPHDCEL